MSSHYRSIILWKQSCSFKRIKTCKSTKFDFNPQYRQVSRQFHRVCVNEIWSQNPPNKLKFCAVNDTGCRRVDPGVHSMFVHDDVIKWKHFPRYWPFVRGIHRSPLNSSHKGQWHGAFDVFFHLRLNKRLSKQWRGWWFDKSSRPLWRHGNGLIGRHGCLTDRIFYRDWKKGLNSTFSPKIMENRGLNSTFSLQIMTKYGSKVAKCSKFPKRGYLNYTILK